MRRITEKGLRKRLGEQVRLEREGIKGNLRYIDGRIKEGEVFGILELDEEGFYVNPFITYWENGFGCRIDKNHFMISFIGLNVMILYI